MKESAVAGEFGEYVGRSKIAEDIVECFSTNFIFPADPEATWRDRSIVAGRPRLHAVAATLVRVLAAPRTGRENPSRESSN